MDDRGYPIEKERAPRPGDETKQIIDRMNQGARSFWERASADTEQRAKDPATLETAVSTLASEERRRIATHDQLSIEAALENADSARSRFRPSIVSENASRAGRAPKGDVLARIITTMVERNPSLTLPALLDQLAAMQGPNMEIDEVTKTNITFATESGKLKDVPISGLKDRLSRAKKKIRARGKRSPHA